MDGIRILLVDDEEDLVATLIERLEYRGFSVTGVHSGHEALRQVDERTFDVVLMDIRMPGLDGFETMKEMKSKHPDLPVILVTGHLPQSTGECAMLSGAFDFFSKPVDLKLLTARIREAVAPSRNGTVND